MLKLQSAAGRGTLAATVAASGMAFLDSTVVNVALPTLGEQLTASLAELQWMLNGYTLTLAAFVLLGGALGDRFGRRRIFELGVVWFTLASLACGLAQNPEMLIIARIVQGMGAALLTPGSLAILQASFAPEDRGRAIGAWSGLSGVTTAIGPFLGGLLIDQASWRWIFWMNVPLAVLVIWLTRRHIPESANGGAERFDVAGALLGALALAALTYGLTTPWWPAIVFAAVCAAAFMVVERQKGDRAMMPLSLFSDRTFAGLNAYTLMVYGAFGGLFFFLVIYLQNVAGYSALEAGMATLPMTLLLLIFSSRVGALPYKSALLVAGPLLCAVGALLLRGAGKDYWTTVFPGVLVFGLGLTLLVAPLTTAVLAAAADRYAGVASGINNAAARAASLLAVAGFPLVVGLSGNEYTQAAPLTEAFRSAALICAGLLLAGAAIGALARPRSPLPSATP